MNRRPPSVGQFSESPTGWTWKRGSPGLAVELDGTLFVAGSSQVSVQGQRFLQVMSGLGIPLQFMKNGVITSPPAAITKAFPSLKLLPQGARAELAIGNWGREFRGNSGRGRLPAGFKQHLETGKIGPYRDEGMFSQDLLDKDYLLNRLSEMGV